MHHPTRIIEVITWPTTLLLSVVISPILLLMLRIVRKESFLIEGPDYLQDSYFNGNYLDLAIVLLSFFTLQKWFYDVAFCLNLKYFPKRNRFRTWQAIILIPGFLFVIYLFIYQIVSSENVYRYEWIWELFVFSWLTITLLAVIRASNLLGKLVKNTGNFYWLFLFLVWPIGIWLIQPKLREAWNREVQKTDTDHFIT